MEKRRESASFRFPDKPISAAGSIALLRVQPVSQRPGGGPSPTACRTQIDEAGSPESRSGALFAGRNRSTN